MREFPSSNSAGSTQKGRSHGNRETKWKSARRIGRLAAWVGSNCRTVLSSTVMNFIVFFPAKSGDLT